LVEVSAEVLLTMHFVWTYLIEVILGGGLLWSVGWAPVFPWKAGAQRTPQINKLAEDARSAERELLIKSDTELSATDVDSKSHEYFVKKLLEAIDYAIKRHDWYEDQRSRVFQSSLTLLSAVLAVLAVVAKATTTSLSEPYPVMLIFFVVGTCVALLRMLWLYSIELNADRPYRLVSDITFWHFRYNLPSASPELTPEGATLAAQNVLSERLATMEFLPRSPHWDKACKNIAIRAELLKRKPPETFAHLLGVEGSIAGEYFRAWSGLSIKWKPLKRYPIPSDWSAYRSRVALRHGIRLRSDGGGYNRGPRTQSMRC
jgi:hypothetical protein